MQLAAIETPTLAIGCELSGPEDGHPVILLHGWPDDVRTWDRVLPAFHGARFKTVVPYLRGFGKTRFRSPKTARSGQLSALGQDLLDLVDVLELEHFSVVGHDWGARAAYIASCMEGPPRYWLNEKLTRGLLPFGWRLKSRYAGEV